MDFVKEILNVMLSMMFVVLNVSFNKIFIKYEIYIINVFIFSKNFIRIYV